MHLLERIEAISDLTYLHSFLGNAILYLYKYTKGKAIAHTTLGTRAIAYY
jgi:hypothetical protein